MSSTEVTTMVEQAPDPEVAFKMTVDSTSNDDKIIFDPQTHLDFVPPEKTYSMSDIHLQDSPISGFAVSEPFRLFSPEAVDSMRNEILSPEVLEHYAFQSNIASQQLRGFAASHAPFIYDTWKNPEVLSIVSKIAGIDLVPVMDYEIAHVNLSWKSEAQKAEEMQTIMDRRLTEEDEGIAGCPWEDDKPIVDWHYDSYPFVCVTMLSSCDNMVGGETALQTGDGSLMKVRGPEKGCVVILQGQYIKHQALRAFGQTERITCVTSFRAKDTSLADKSVLTTVRPISNIDELYYQYLTYRLEDLEEEIRTGLKRLRTQHGRKKFDAGSFRSLCEKQANYLLHTGRQLVPEELVTKGEFDHGDSNPIYQDFPQDVKI